MRKLNTILSVLLLVIFLLHGIMGSFMLLGIGSNAGKILAWVGVAVLAVHAGIGIILTVQTLRAEKIAPIIIENRMLCSGQDAPADLRFSF